jgi:hypothetical protein
MEVSYATEIKCNNIYHERGNRKQIVRFETFTAVAMKNVVFWDIETQFVPHKRHITSPLQSPAG